MFGAAVRKDLLLLVRDRAALVSLFLLPLVFIAVFGSLWGGDGRPAPVRLAVWHAPDDPRGGAIAGALGTTGLFVVERAASPEAARPVGADAVGLVLPADLDPRAGRPAELVLDASAPPQVRRPLEDGVAAVVAHVALGPPPSAGLEVVRVVAASGGAAPTAEVTGFQVTVPGNAVLFGFFLALQVALSFVEERRSGTWRRVLASPARRRWVLLAKLVPYVLVGLVQFAFLFGLGALAFGMEVRGSLAALVTLTVAVVLCAAALGLAIASLGGTEKQVGGIGSICLLVMGLIGGSMVPRMFMPELMRTLSLAVPHAWALDGYFDALVRPGTRLADVLPEVAALGGFTAAFAAFGALTFRFEK
jgi:ABC-2 type transport system permease protein